MSPGGPASRYHDLAERLRSVVEELDDASFELLHGAVAAGATSRPAADKTLTQARRAIEKAAALLDTLTTDPPTPTPDPGQP